MSQLALFDLEVAPTEAMRRGDASVWQCASCGSVLYRPSGLAQVKKKLGACPACAGATWWRQELPVGPFRARSQP